MMMNHSSTFALAFVVLAAAACSSSGNGGDKLGDTDTSGNTAVQCPTDNPNCREAATVKAGEVAAGRRKCGDCHDSDKGKMAGSETSLSKTAGVELYPPNLTPDVDTGIGGWTDDQLATAIRIGLDKEGLELCPQMEHAPNMSDFEAYSLVMYLRSLTPVKHAVLRSVCPPLKAKSEQK